MEYIEALQTEVQRLEMEVEKLQARKVKIGELSVEVLEIAECLLLCLQELQKILVLTPNLQAEIDGKQFKH